MRMERLRILGVFPWTQLRGGCHALPDCQAYPGRVSPALAQQTIAFPVSAPPECTELAQCENVPTLIENKYQAALARIKLARLSGAEPIVAQCKQAVERLKVATRG